MYQATEAWERRDVMKHSRYVENSAKMFKLDDRKAAEKTELEKRRMSLL